MHFPGDDELDSFPIAPDFDVALRDSGDAGKHIFFVSRTSGTLAGFPAWDHADRDLRHFIASDVPMGTISDPYDDADENWRIVIFEHRGFIYVLEGDSPKAEDYPRFFRVPSERYFAAWAALIAAYNPVTPLADPEP